MPLIVELHNAGDTRWLHQANEPGWTRLGAHLRRADRARSLIDYDWFRAPLPHDVGPEGGVRLDVQLPPITEAGDYLLVFDLVIRGQPGSPNARP